MGDGEEVKNRKREEESRDGRIGGNDEGENKDV